MQKKTFKKGCIIISSKSRPLAIPPPPSRIYFFMGGGYNADKGLISRDITGFIIIEHFIKAKIFLKKPELFLLLFIPASSF